ncbi:MAG: DUF5010 domain-containing protein [Bacteroidia bacterium]|nr:DUF5010 domain-containing protein [Bacteroidia bacterium]
MNPKFVGITILFSILSVFQNTFSQELGATFCWQYKEIQGGHPYRYNQSIVKSTIAENEWWENMVEEVDYAGLDYIALLSRGTTPGKSDRGAGDPNQIPYLVDAMNTRGVNSFKLAIFDDCPNSWTAGMNYDLYPNAPTDVLFDCSDLNNYKYIWDYNLKIAIEKIPDERRYKIDGRMVIIFWSVKDTWMTNINGNLEKILTHIKTKCYETYGFYPYFITMRSWFDREPTLQNSTLVDAVHNWFSSAGATSYTLQTWTDLKTRQVRKSGCCVPGFSAVDDVEGRPFLDPTMGTSYKGARLKMGLDNTVKAGASVTLVEGFTDAAEFAALWRSTDDGQYKFYEYPNQRLNILRSYSRNPYPISYKMESEACDDYLDLTTGNSGGTYLEMGDLDVAKCNDLRGGWNVTGTQAGEWLQWRDLPLLTSTKFQLRYKSSAVSSVNIAVDGIPLPTVSLPFTNGLWFTVDVGTYTTAINSLHTVRLNILSGNPDVNYLNRINGTINPVTSISILPANATLSKDQTLQMSAVVAPNNADNKFVTWVSENPKIAIVNADGLITAVGPGTAKIWAMTQDGEKAASMMVNVPGILYLDDCDNTSGWTSSQTLSLNTVDEMQGTGCVQFSGSTTDEFKKVFSPAFNSGTTLANGAFRCWYYVSDVTKCGPIRVELGSSGKADVNEYSWSLSGLVNGWNKIDLKMSTSSKAGTLDLNAINWFRIYDSKSGSITTRIDALEVYNSDLNAVKEMRFDENEIAVYPNPVKNVLNIKVIPTNWKNIEVTLYDLSGKMLIHKTVTIGYESFNQLDVSQLKAGLYLLKITSDEKSITKKVNITS